MTTKFNCKVQGQARTKISFDDLYYSIYYLRSPPRRKEEKERGFFFPAPESSKSLEAVAWADPFF